MKRWIGIAAFVFLLGFLVLPWRAVFGQATTGYTKIGTVAFGTNTFTDTTPVSGQVTSYEVTSLNAAGESGPSNIVSATTPTSTASHSNTLTWTPPTTGGTPTSYNVYSLAVVPSGPPTGLAVVAK